jgi:hypothetical protein
LALEGLAVVPIAIGMEVAGAPSNISILGIILDNWGGSYSNRFILEIILDNPIAIGWGGVGGASATPVGTAGPFRAKNAFFWLWRGLRELLPNPL